MANPSMISALCNANCRKRVIIPANACQAFRWDDDSNAWCQFQCSVCGHWCCHVMSKVDLETLRLTSRNQIAITELSRRDMDDSLYDENVRHSPLDARGIDRWVWSFTHEADFAKEVQQIFEAARYFSTPEH